MQWRRGRGAGLDGFERAPQSSCILALSRPTQRLKRALSAASSAVPTRSFRAEHIFERIGKRSETTCRLVPAVHCANGFRTFGPRALLTAQTSIANLRGRTITVGRSVTQSLGRPRRITPPISQRFLKMKSFLTRPGRLFPRWCLPG